MVIIHVCIGSACHLKGSYHVIHRLQEIIEERKLEDQVLVKAAFCLGECTTGVSVKVNEGAVVSVNEENVDDFFDKFVVGRLSK